jgi:hypothetical protein
MFTEFRSSFKVASISNIFLPLMLKVVSSVAKIKKYLDKKCKILFFNSYILPIFDFCCTVWGNCSEEGIQRITKLQKRTARIILDAPFFTPTQHEIFIMQQIGVLIIVLFII